MKVFSFNILIQPTSTNCNNSCGSMWPLLRVNDETLPKPSYGQNCDENNVVGQGVAKGHLGEVSWKRVHKLSQTIQNTNARSTSIENFAFKELDASEIPSSVYHKTMVKEQWTSHMFTSQGLSIALPDWPLYFTASDWKNWLELVMFDVELTLYISVGQTLLLSRLSMIFLRL